MIWAKYPTKKSLKDAVASGKNTWDDLKLEETSIHGAEWPKKDGKVTFVGPDAYNKRTFYGTLHVRDGIVVKVQ